MKKGILITLGLTFFVLVILSLATVIYHYNLTSDQRLLEAAALERIYNLDKSIEKGLWDLYNSSAGITIITSQTSTRINVTFSELLPNNQSIFSAATLSFANYINTFDPSVIVNASLLSTELPLIIHPYNINYHHPDSTQVRIIPGDYTEIASYNFLVHTGEANITGITTFFPGSLSVNIKAIDNFGNQQSFSDTVDPTLLANSLSITTSHGSIVFNITNPGIMAIISKASNPITLNTTLDLIATPSTKLEIRFPSNTTIINLSQLGMTKVGSPIIYYP